MVTVPLKLCSFDKNRKVLKVSSEFFSGGFPEYFMVDSHHTGMQVRFTKVGLHDVLYDEDGWDGEMCIYRPLGNVPKVDHAVVYHEY